MNRLVDFTGLKIKLASPEVIKSWSHGEVTKPETINYRTLKAEKDGLFSESIFGPTKDWECYCGKYKRIRYKGIICDKCGVEVTQSRVRRERMGHIELAAPVAHIWFFKGASSKISLLLNIPPKSLESIIYFAQYLVTVVDKGAKKEAVECLEAALAAKREELKGELVGRIKEAEEGGREEEKMVKEKLKNNKEQLVLAAEEIKLKTKQRMQALRDENLLELERAGEIYRMIIELVKNLREWALLSEDEYLKLVEYGVDTFFQAGMGAEVLLEVVKLVNLEKLAAELREGIQESRGAKHIKLSKRLRLVEGMRKAEIDPAWMILQILPVIPPDLRPMVQLSGGRFATSDLNDLYRRVINRNNRLKHLMALGAPEIILRNEKRMLQEAVDSLIDVPRRMTQRNKRQVRPLRSLSEMLRGKQGRFRQNLLGKRVDYSGRSVIVVGPELKLNQCGLPKEMALEMFKPFVLHELIMNGMAPNVKSAKYALEHRPPEIFDILEKITQNHPVLLNRAPTLHKLGIQAFYPILIEGNAIRIHPCVCAGFNADFDGDQMAVHVPLSVKAQEEAAKLMSPVNNLLKPSSGEPINIPDKEMALGCYFLTSVNEELPPAKTIFADGEEVVFAFQSHKIELRQMIKVRHQGKIIETTAGRILFNEVLPLGMAFVNESVKQKMIKALITQAMRVSKREETVEFIDSLKRLGFWGSTLSGLSVGVWDCQIYPDKGRVISEANQKAVEIQGNFAQGLITRQEQKRLVQELWMETTQLLADKTWEQFSLQNSIYLMVDAGLRRISKDGVKQISAMQGLVVDPLGKIVELPIKSNFREGLSIFEYLTSARGARKGLTDTAIKTSDAGYLTRRLVDAAHDLLIKSEDCGTKSGIRVSREDKRGEKFLERILGRFLAKEVADPKTKKTLFRRNKVIDEEVLKRLDEAGVGEVWVRSSLTCESKYGLCAKCYGWDFSWRGVVEMGVPVGVIAAQSIGEPGTQLTLRTKQTGGIVGLDVTQGLPRVEELFEARVPKNLSPLAEIAGKVSLVEMENGYKVRVVSVGIKPAEEREYVIPAMSKLKVEEGQLVDAGTQLASGSLDVREVLEVRGLLAAQEYLVEEIQLVYESQGVPINDRHIEVIVRRMSDKVRIEGPGDTHFLPGELVSKTRFEEENRRVLAEGGEPATARVIILGLTRTSLFTESWLSAASFQETTNVLSEASLEGKEDGLLGLKENVIIGRLIPVAAEQAVAEG
ncbi:MAG: DNA-directed RNA polymerase subunit beta' [Candidatus Shapirobacteria bacterium]